MRTVLRHFFAISTFGIAAASVAQPVPPYPIGIAATILGCSPNAQITVGTLPGTLPALNYTFDLVNCTFDTLLFMDSPTGGFILSTSCNGVLVTANHVYSVDVLGSDSIYALLNCNGIGVDCTGIPNGPSMPGTACDDGNPLTVGDTWNLNCVCTGIATPPCNACFNVSSSQPWVAEFTNCTTGGSAPYAFEWTFSDGAISVFSNPTWTLNSPGVYWACLTITDINACTSTTCDSIFVDANGGITTDPVLPCIACVDAVPATNGPSGQPIPWTVDAINCSTGGVEPVSSIIIWGDGATGGNNPHIYNQPGTYQVCILISDANGCTSTSCDSVIIGADGTVNPTDPGDCQAGFWVIQAYTVDSMSGETAPIPNELWLWNLSTGGNGNYQFVWSWGDGTPDSTDPYPTHFYANGGPYYLCLTMYDGNGCTDTYCDSVSVDEDGLYNGMIVQSEANYARSGFTIRVLNEVQSGITDRPALENTVLWPNPVTDEFYLKFNSTLRGNVPMSIIDLNGRVISTTNTIVTSGTNQLRIPVVDLAPGLYVLRIGNDTNALNLRFAKN